MPKPSTIKYQISNIRNLKVAIVHDWFLADGGAELVAEQIHKLYPEAPIYTSYCSDKWRKRLDNKVVTGYLQHWPFSALRKFLPVLRQHWFRRLDLSGFDLVISSSGNGEAKFVLPKKDDRYQQTASSDTAMSDDVVANDSSDIRYQISDMQRDSDAQRPLHICYSHTPTHFYWRKYEEYLKNPSFQPKWLARLGLRILVKPLRKRDYQAAQSVDYFIANSSHIQKDIQEYYGRDSVVIHPPVNTKKFGKQRIDNSKQQIVNSGTKKRSLSDIDKPRFIAWGRHVPYKRFDLAIKACNTLQLPLTIIGQGPETEALKKIAGPTITFTGRISDEELIARAHAAQAFLFPGEEDFGIAPVEALAAGLPVIAYKSGGALDYVEEGKTGLFFSTQSVEALVDCLGSFSETNFNEKIITNKAQQFSEDLFGEKITKVVKKFLSN